MMELVWPYTQKARQQYHKEGTGLESPGARCQEGGGGGGG